MGLPAVYLFYGDNRFGIDQALDSLQNKLGSAASIDMQRFSGPELDLGTLRQASASVPFMADRRLVIVDEAESLPAGEHFRQELIKTLETVPDSTALVFAAHIPQDRRAMESFQKRSTVFIWASENPESAFIRQFASPRGAAFSSWLMKRAEQLGGALERQAAELLADLIEEDALLAEQELRKLIAFADEDQPVSTADVENLTPIYGQADIFEAIDALGSGSGSFRRLQRLIEEQDPSYVFLMVVRQFRLMLQARHALEQGVDPMAVLKVPGFVGRKLAAQARNFSLPALEEMYHRLQEFDLRMKRGDADPSIDLIPLIASLLAPAKPDRMP